MLELRCLKRNDSMQRQQHPSFSRSFFFMNYIEIPANPLNRGEKHFLLKITGVLETKPFKNLVMLQVVRGTFFSSQKNAQHLWSILSFRETSPVGGWPVLLRGRKGLPENQPPFLLPRKKNMLNSWRDICFFDDKWSLNIILRMVNK